jgi:hypothetical protein
VDSHSRKRHAVRWGGVFVCPDSANNVHANGNRGEVNSMLITYRYPFLAPDDGTGAAGSEGGDGKAQSSDAGKTGDATGPNGGQQSSGSESKTFTQEDIDRIIDDRLKRAKKTWEQEEKDKAAEAAKPEIDRLKSENDTIKGQLTAFQQQVRERDAKDAVSDAAKKAGATDASPIWRMIKSDLEYDDEGKVKNLAELIRDAKSIAPQLFKPVSGKADAGAGNGTRAPKSGDWIRQLTNPNS